MKPVHLPLLVRYTDKFKFSLISIYSDPDRLVSGGYIVKQERFQIYPKFGWVQTVPSMKGK